MITKVVTPQDAIQALNENLEGLLTGKRKVNIVKETNNTLGKLLEVHKLEAISKNLSGDKSGLSWFAQPKSQDSLKPYEFNKGLPVIPSAHSKTDKQPVVSQ